MPKNKQTTSGKSCGPLVLICGLGIKPQLDVSIETIGILESCRKVFYTATDKNTKEWLRKFFPKLQAATKPMPILTAARQASPIGLAVWGHAQFSSSLARQVGVACKKNGIPYRIYPSVSPIGHALVKALDFSSLNWVHYGMDALPIESCLQSPLTIRPAVPLVIFSEKPATSNWRKLHQKLSRLYPEKHPLWIISRSNNPAISATFKVLAKSSMDPSAILLAPRPQ